MESPLHRFLRHIGDNAWEIARDGLLNATEWSDAIDAWQAPYVNDESKPLWYRGMLFNELYALTDGGTFWGRPVGSDTKAPPHLLCSNASTTPTTERSMFASMRRCRC